MFYLNSKLSDSLRPTEVNRLLRKDIERRSSIPLEITGGARKTGLIDLLFFANASAGDFSSSVSLDLDTVPLSLVWFLGVVDKDNVVTEGGGLVPGSSFDSGTVLEGAEVFSGAIANYSCDKDNLTVKITSTNVGWSVFLVATFKYAIYYDNAEVKVKGL